MGRYSGAVTLSLCAVGLVIGTWDYGLWDPWEMDLASVARRMAELPPVLVVEDRRADDRASLMRRLCPSGAHHFQCVSLEESRATATLNAATPVLGDQVFLAVVVDASSLRGDRPHRDLASFLAYNVLRNRSTHFFVVGLPRSGKTSFVGSQALRDAVMEQARSLVQGDDKEAILVRLRRAVSFSADLSDVVDQLDRASIVDSFTAQFKSSGRTVFLPPLEPFAVSLAYRVFGYTEFASRLPFVLAGIVLLLVFFWLSRWHFGQPTATLATVVLASSPIFFESFRLVSREATLMIFLALGGFGLLALVDGRGRRGLSLLVASLVLMYLAGGMTAAVTLVAMVLGYSIAAADRRREVWLAVLVMVGGTCLLALFTFLPDSAFFRQFRFTAPTFAGGLRARARSFDFVIKEFGFGLFPWTALLPAAFLRFLRVEGEERRRGVALLVWALVHLGVLMVVLRPLHHYLYAGAPAVALLVGLWLSKPGEASMQERWLAFLGLGSWLVVLKDLTHSPAPLVSFLMTDPKLAEFMAGEPQFPEAVGFGGLSYLGAFLAAAGLLAYGAKVVDLARRAVAAMEGRVFRWTLGLCLGLLLADVAIFTALKWETIAAGGYLGHEVLLRVLLTGPDVVLLYAATLLVLCMHFVPRLVTRRSGDGGPTALSFSRHALAAVQGPQGLRAATIAGAVLVAVWSAFLFMPELSVHFSQKHLIEAYESSSRKVPGKLYRYGGFRSKGAGERNFYTAMLDSLRDASEAVRRLGDQRERSFVIVPKNQFSELNYRFRQRHDGKHIHVLDASSSKFVLAVSSLAEGETDHNWIAQHTLTTKKFDALTGVRHTYVNFGDKIELIGYKLEPQAVPRGGRPRLTLFFRAKGRMNKSYRVFLHIDHTRSATRIHGDHYILNLKSETENTKNCTGCFSTAHWLAGDVVEDEYVVKVPIGVPSGAYTIWMGLYHPSTERRLPVKDYDKEKVRHDGNNRVAIGRLVVE